MPPIIWIAIAIIMLGIGASASLPELPRYVFQPIVEKGVEVFKPIAWALALAFVVLAGIYVYKKWSRREEK
jgi:hypothetical protein